ncbi:hypothetical protein BDD12DRAFT_857680 [Trichophaea hybrida]|nr:hypothetical protein BDD12DRAFT_857680 [Trichophaea hybrida]
MLPNLGIAILTLSLFLLCSGVLYLAIRYVKSSRNAVLEVLGAGHNNSDYTSCSSSEDESGGGQTTIVVRQG